MKCSDFKSLKLEEFQIKMCHLEINIKDILFHENRLDLKNKSKNWRSNYDRDADFIIFYKIIEVKL